MKKIIFLLFVLAAVSCGSDDSNSAPPESTIYKGDIEIFDQQSLYALAAKKYTRIEGNLEIYGSIYNLDGLETLKEVTGDFRIYGGEVLSNIDGLQNLNKAGSLSIGRTMLTNLDALNAFTTVGVIDISRNPLLVNISGLKNLTTASDLSITDNAALSTLHGLEGITSLVKLSIGGNHLTTLSGLDNLASATTIVIVEGITSLLEFANLTQASYVQLQGTQLVNLDGLQALHQVEDFTLVDNKKLTSLAGLENLTEANVIKLVANFEITSIAALSHLTILGHKLTTGGLFIKGCYDLPTLDGVQNVSQFKGSVIIYAAETLKDFCALQNILQNGNLNSVSITSNSGSVPSPEDIIAGNCTID